MALSGKGDILQEILSEVKKGHLCYADTHVLVQTLEGSQMCLKMELNDQRCPLTFGIPLVTYSPHCP